MGLGDDMLFLGEAEKIHKETGKKVFPVNYRRSAIFENVDFLTFDRNEEHVKVNVTNQPPTCLRDGEKVDYHIPYYVKEEVHTKNGMHFIWNEDYKPVPFKLKFSQEELRSRDRREKHMPAPWSEYIVVNPDVKNSFFKGNKNWGFDNWQKLTTKLHEAGHLVVRFKPSGAGYDEPMLKNCANILEVPLRIALAIKSKVKLGVTFDGLLSHVWAGAEVPCVRICGGFMSSKTLHYDNNLSLALNNNPIGKCYPSQDIIEANKKITVDMVYDACMKQLNY